MRGEKLINSLNDNLMDVHAMVVKLSIAEAVDLGARIRSFRDRVVLEDDCMTTLLKPAARPLVIPGNGNGILGHRYAALVSESERDTFDVKSFKDFDPKTYAQFVRTTHIVSLRYKPL